MKLPFRKSKEAKKPENRQKESEKSKIEANSGWDYKEYRLDNGLLVALERTPTQTISGRLRVNYGLLNELPGEEGYAHFVEHMISLGGSKNYSPSESVMTKGLFGFSSAKTNSTETAFPIGMQPSDLEAYLKYISDSAMNPIFDPKVLEEERIRILRELADKKSSTSYEDFKKFSRASYGEDSPHLYHYQILENLSAVEKATRENLRSFHGRGYNPNNMDLILVGGLPENTEELIEKYFSDFKKGRNQKVRIPKNKSHIGPIEFHTNAPDLYNKESSELSADLYIHLYAPTLSEEDGCATALLNYVLGGSYSSRLFEIICREKGLAYGLGSGYTSAEELGEISISGSVQPQRAQEAINAIFEEMKKLQRDLVPQNILEEAKKKLRYQFAKEIETNGGRLGIIEQKLEGYITNEEIINGTSKVTAEDVRNAAIKYLPKDRETGNYVLLLRDPLKGTEYDPQIKSAKPENSKMPAYQNTPPAATASAQV